LKARFIRLFSAIISLMLRTMLALTPALCLLAPSAFAQDPGHYIRLIEGPQAPNRQGFDPYSVPQMMRLLGVPAVSVAVIKDFKIHWAMAWGLADVAANTPATTETLFQAASISKPVAAMASLRAAQEGHFRLDQDINTILKSWKMPPSEFTRDTPVTPRMLLSHTSGLGDGHGYPGYEPGAPLPSLPQIFEGKPPSKVSAVLMERPPLAAFKYSGGGTLIQQLALTDALGKPFPQILRELVLDPAGMANSTYEQPLPAAREVQAARAHSASGQPMNVKYHVYPELAAAGLWTTPTDLARLAIELQLALRGKSQRVLNQTMAQEMVTPVGTGPFAVGFSIERRGEGWYFSHGGSNWGFRCDLTAHRLKGYGVAIMTNSDSGDALIREIRDRVAAAYGWDSLDKPVLRAPAPR
jgi:CubicO group peptidase (beta-lactamase class C family)